MKCQECIHNEMCYATHTDDSHACCYFKNAADVAPVVHAKWDVNGHCTNCGGHAPFYCMTSTYYKSPYCFECGAKIDGEDGEHDGTQS